MLQDKKKGQRNKVGACGELIAQKYLEKKGLLLLERNFLRKCGEIDLVMRQNTIQETGETETLTTVHFVEVKTLSYKTKAALEYAVSHETWRPEEQVHTFKLKKLFRTIELWCLEKGYKGEWQLDVMAVRVVPGQKYATAKYIPNIIDS
jgi:putative endonuclease